MWNIIRKHRKLTIVGVSRACMSISPISVIRFGNGKQYIGPVYHFYLFFIKTNTHFFLILNYPLLLHLYYLLSYTLYNDIQLLLKLQIPVSACKLFKMHKLGLYHKICNGWIKVKLSYGKTGTNIE